MKYLKHKYSKRVYQVRLDHGPEHPELVHFHQIRCPSPLKLERFFIPTTQEPSGGDGRVSIPQEIEWENRKLLGDKPLEVKTPPQKKRERVSEKTHAISNRSKETGEYTLADLCQELGITPSLARRLLRSKGKTAPAGGWKWANPKEAKTIKKIIKNLL